MFLQHVQGLYHFSKIQLTTTNLIRTRIWSALVFADFLNEKKLVRGSNPHLSFNRPFPKRQTDSVMSDDGESDE